MCSGQRRERAYRVAHSTASGGSPWLGAGPAPKRDNSREPGFSDHARRHAHGRGATQFGIDAEQVPALLQELGACDVALAGFHVFWGSQCLHPATIVEAQRRCAGRHAARIRFATAAPVRESGRRFWHSLFRRRGAARSRCRRPADACLALAHATGFARSAPRARTWRYLVGEAGAYVCRVIDRKVSRGTTFLVTDGGLHHHLAASGNFGQVLRRNFPVVLGNRFGDTPTERCHIVGCSCTPLDRIADDVLLPEAQIGDFVVVLQSGAYARSASPRISSVIPKQSRCSSDTDASHPIRREP